MTGPVKVTIGGADAQVLLAGLAPGFAGVYQLNVLLPAALEAGEHDVVVEVSGQASPAGVTIAVR